METVVVHFGLFLEKAGLQVCQNPNLYGIAKLLNYIYHIIQLIIIWSFCVGWYKILNNLTNVLHWQDIDWLETIKYVLIQYWIKILLSVIIFVIIIFIFLPIFDIKCQW